MNFLWGSKTITIDEKNQVKNDIFSAVFNGQTDRVLELLNKFNINLNDYNDCYANNLLHIAVNAGNLELARQLIFRKINKDATNIFGHSSLDLAIKNNNKNLISLLINNGLDINFLKNENSRLQNDILNMNEINNKLLEANNQSTSKYNMLYIKWQSEINNRKRSQEDCDFYERESKRLKIDNDNFVKDNNVLKITVNNLRNKK